MHIRAEARSDEGAIDRLLDSAFARRSHTDHAEPAIVRALRADGDLTLSLVVETEGKVAAHVAFSPLVIADTQGPWFGLGPLAVWPRLQRQGIGTALVHQGLSELRLNGAAGCVVLGDPSFYGRLGFVSDGQLRYKNLPTRFVQRIVFHGAAPSGEIVYARAFDLAE
jgi:putative acetyltransferase